ncbi:MAG: formate/nitrite transporter family protein, partial [Bacteroidota bacterium]
PRLVLMEPQSLVRAPDARSDPHPTTPGELAGDIGRSVRDAMDSSGSGAPASGRAVRDILSTNEIFRRVVATADEEFSEPNRLLFFSGLAAGLSIALSFIAKAGVTGATDAEMLGNVVYPIGFVFIVLGRYQLFTENTLTPVALVLTRRASIPRLLTLWTLVYAANLLGSAIAAFAIAHTPILTPEAFEYARDFGKHALETTPTQLFWKGLIAGWLVAGMVWLTHAVRDATTRFFLVFVIMFLIPSADLFHCIVGSCEVFFLAFLGEAGFVEAFTSFILPTTAGNTVGGVLLVAVLNFAQTHDSTFSDRGTLTWKEMFMRRSVSPRSK